MKAKFSQKHPVTASILWALLLLIFYFASGFAIAVTKVSATNAMLIRAACIFVPCLLAVIYIGYSKRTFFELALKD